MKLTYLNWDDVMTIIYIDGEKKFDINETMYGASDMLEALGEILGFDVDYYEIDEGWMQTYGELQTIEDNSEGYLHIQEHIVIPNKLPDMSDYEEAE